MQTEDQVVIDPDQVAARVHPVVQRVTPFTDTAPQVPDMIITEDQVDGIVTVLDEIRGHALPDLTVA